MKPLFGSSDPSALPPHLQWYIPERTEYVGTGMLLAGPPVGLRTHRVGRRTWPCLLQWPQLGRECPHCERSTRFTCWVPMLSLNRPMKRVVKMGALTTWNSVKDIAPLTIVECHYAKMLKPTLVFKKEKLQLGALVLREAAEELNTDRGDITRWLLHYWQWSELSKWWGEAFRESVKTRTTRERAELHGRAQVSQPLFGSVA